MSMAIFDLERTFVLVPRMYHQFITILHNLYLFIRMHGACTTLIELVVTHQTRQPTRS